VSGETDVVQALREGMAKPEILEFGVVAEVWLLTCRRLTWLSPNGQYEIHSSGRREAGCALP